jgi:preprotein translocase subunit SecF
MIPRRTICLNGVSSAILVTSIAFIALNALNVEADIPGDLNISVHI